MRTYQPARRTTGGFDPEARILKKQREAVTPSRKNDDEGEETDDMAGEDREPDENPRKRLRSFARGSTNQSSSSGDSEEVGVEEDEGQSSLPVETEEEEGQAAEPQSDLALLRLLNGKNEEIRILTEMLTNSNKKRDAEVKRWKDEALEAQEKLKVVEEKAHRRQNKLMEKLRKNMEDCKEMHIKNVELKEKLEEAEGAKNGCEEFIEKLRRRTMEQATLLGII